MLTWREIAGNWVYIPRRPSGIIHFLGGAFVATAPNITYKMLLEELGQEGYVIIATPFINTFDHLQIAKEVYQKFNQALDILKQRQLLPDRFLPIYGIGHSMGCKLHLLIGSYYPVERQGNILIAFNNFAARDSIPFLDKIPQDLYSEFTPSPEETLSLIYKYYDVRRNLIIKFRNDTIDQSISLHQTLAKIFPEMIYLQKINGNHLTPLGQDLQWQIGQEFSLFDAVGQWFKQELQRDYRQMQKEILRWLNPVSNAGW